MKRRLVIGSVLTIGTIALALIPTEDLDGFANKPLFVYLVPLLRSIVRFYHTDDLMFQTAIVPPDAEHALKRLLCIRNMHSTVP